MTGSAYPAHRSIPALFVEQAQTRPHAVAVLDGGHALTYGELAAWASTVAARLGEAGAGPGDVVGVLAPRGAPAVAAMLGTLWAGAAYMPLAPGDPRERHRALADAGGVRLVLAAAPDVGTTDSAVPGCLVCPIPPAPASQVEAGPPAWTEAPQPGGEASAAVLFTSGSTGGPKPVDIPHRAIVRLLFGQRYAAFGPDQVFLHLAPLSFDASTFEIWGALLHGGRLVIARDDVPDLPGLEATIAAGRVTTVWLNAALFNVIIDERPQALVPVRQLLIGGEALSVPHVRKALRLLPQTRIVNGYGPTENTTFSTWYDVPRDLPADLVSIPIGRALAHSAARVVDERLQPVEAGVEGEILVAGEGVARGYRNRPDLTAEVFVPDPAGVRGDELAYRTGDRGVLLPDGNIRFLGRRDAQVKIRGYRIEPGEVEAAIAGVPGARRSAVVAVGDANDGARASRLVAFVVTDDAAAAGAVLPHLRAVLPAHMLPSDVRPVNALPLTPHGKVDRASLAALVSRQPTATPAVDAVMSSTVARPVARELSGTSLESVSTEILTAIEESLGYRPAPDDNLPACGLHSLLVVRLAARLSERFGVRVTPADVFANPTVTALAARVSASPVWAGPEPTLVPPARTNRELPFPLTHAQQRAWLVQTMAPESAAYTFEARLTLRGALDTPALDRALTALVGRHEVLRSVFDVDDGSPVQLVRNPGVAGMSRVDLTALPAAEREAALEADRQRRSRRPFVLDRLPLIEWTLYRTDEYVHVLHHREHHLLHDGASFYLLLQELAALYRAETSGQATGVPAPAWQVGDVAEWERRWLESGASVPAVAYWRSRLDGAPPVSTWPLERPRPPVMTYRGECVRVEIGAPVVERVRQAAARAGVTFFTAMLAPFAAELASEARAREVCIGTGVANRDAGAASRVVGMLVNNAVLRLPAGSTPSLRALMHDTQQAVADALVHQAAPFDVVVHETGARQVDGVHPLCQVFFSAIEGTVPAELGPGVALAVEVGLPTGSAKFDHNVVLVVQREDAAAPRPVSERVSLIWEFSTDLYSRPAMERRLARYLAALERLPDSMDTPRAACGETPDREAVASRSASRASRVRPSGGMAEIRSCHAEQVAAIVSGVLGRDAVGPDDDFFSLGGHSLLAVRLAARLAEATGRPFPVRHLFADATVRGICRVLDGDSGREPVAPPSPCRVVVQTAAAGRPVYLVPGAGGDDGAMAFYARLAPFVPDRTVVGLRAVAPGSPAVLLRPDVGSLAALFADEIVAASDPADAVDLVGGCTGGVVAFAVACELRRRGRPVRRLVLLDSRCPSWAAGLKASVRMACCAIRHHAQRLLRGGAGALDEGRAASFYRTLSACLPFDEDEAPAEVSQASRAFVVGTMRHRPAGWAGDVHVIASAAFAAARGPDAWQRHVQGSVRVDVVPGTHESYIREHLAEAGAALRRALGPDA